MVASDSLLACDVYHVFRDRFMVYNANVRESCSVVRRWFLRFWDEDCVTTFRFLSNHVVHILHSSTLRPMPFAC